MLGNFEKFNVWFLIDLKGYVVGIEKVVFNFVKDVEFCSFSKDGVVKFWDVRMKVCVNEVKDFGDVYVFVWVFDGFLFFVGNRVSLLNDLLL